MSDTKLVSQIRQIICHSNEAAALNCKEIILNATRFINNCKYTGQLFLIANVDDFVRKNVLLYGFWEKVTFLSLQLRAIEYFCNDTKIELLHLKKSELYFYIEDSNKNGKEQRYHGRIAYVEIEAQQTQHEDNPNPNPDILVQEYGIITKFHMVGTIKDPKFHYNIYADTSFNTQSVQLFRKHVINMIYKQVKNILVKGISKKNINRLNSILTTTEYNEVDMTAPLESPEDLLELLRQICLIFYQRISIKKIDTYSDFGKQSINSETPITVIWFIDKAQNPDSYLPTILFNENTKKLNFLVWYSDCDQNGFMRHSAINEEDVLSARLTSHVKMLIYCEDLSRQIKYSRILMFHKTNAVVSVAPDTHKSVFSQENYHNILMEIPRINESYYRSPLSGDTIKNAFFL